MFDSGGIKAGSWGFYFGSGGILMDPSGNCGLRGIIVERLDES